MINLPKHIGLRYVVAFSGGADSALLAFLLKQGGYDFRLVHVMHPDSKASNGAEKIRDFCIEWAKYYGLEITVLTATVDERMVKSQGIEAAERVGRYDALYGNLLLNETLLTGHHLDDSIETFFFRLCRGSSVKGLSGISSNPKNSRLIRPLIHLSKEEILQQVEALSILYGHDSTNDSTELSRGFIRNKVIPLLKEHFTSWKFYASLERAMQNMSECSALIEDLYHIDNQSCGSGETGIDRVNLRKLSDYRQRNFLYHHFSVKFGKYLTRNAIEEVQKRINGPKRDDKFEVSGMMVTLCNETAQVRLAKDVNN